MKKLNVKPEKEEKNEEGDFLLVCLVDPVHFRPLDDLLRDETKGEGKLELLDLKEVVNEEERL